MTGYMTTASVKGRYPAAVAFLLDVLFEPAPAQESNVTPIKTYDDILLNLGAATEAVAADSKAAADRSAKFDSDSAALKAAFDSDSSAIATQLKSDSSDRDSADSALKAAVKASGGLAKVNADGTVTAYEPDGQGGYTTKTLTVSTQPVPA